MKRFVSIRLAALLSCMFCSAQRISDGGYRTVGHATDIPMEWAALYIFFKP